ncbi:MAG: radical SAM protein [Nitrospirota bacterium]
MRDLKKCPESIEENIPDSVIIKKMTKYLLINPNTVKPPVAPLGIEYLASFLKERGVEVEIFDMNIQDEDYLTEILKNYGPDVTGISVRNIDDSCFATQESFLHDIKALVYRIKTVLPKTMVVLGGVGFSTMPLDVLSFTGADIGIYGDGEEGLLGLSQNTGRCVLQEIPNIVFSKRMGRSGYFNLKDFFPRRGFIDNRFYFHNGGMVGIETSRGCNRDCIYCADPIAKGRKIRLRNPQSIIDEFEQLLYMGIDHFHTCDCEFNFVREHVIDICERIIERGYGEHLHWYAYCVVDGFDEELAEIMKKAGCEGINFGVDHTDDEILKFYRRRHRLKDIRKAVNACRKAGIRVMLDLLLGAPGETLDTMRKLFEDMKSVEPTRVGVSYGIRIYPNTEFHNFLKRSGYAFSENLFLPAFFIEPKILSDIDRLISKMVEGDEIFFFNSREQSEKNYNYNANEILTEAITKEGYRGAFWDILYRKYEDSKNNLEAKLRNIS